MTLFMLVLLLMSGGRGRRSRGRGRGRHIADLATDDQLVTAPNRPRKSCRHASLPSITHTTTSIAMTLFMFLYVLMPGGWGRGSRGRGRGQGGGRHIAELATDDALVAATIQPRKSRRHSSLMKHNPHPHFHRHDIIHAPICFDARWPGSWEPWPRQGPRPWPAYHTLATDDTLAATPSQPRKNNDSPPY